MENNNDILVVVDCSYWTYYTLFGAVVYFENKCDEASKWLKPIEECDQKNLPNLLNCEAFKKILKHFVMTRLEKIDEIVKANFQDKIDLADHMDFVFAMDDNLSHNFRLSHYPEYKAQRALVPRRYQVRPIKEYITEVMFKELEVEEKYGYHMIRVNGAEGDDVVATTIKNFKDRYGTVVLIASDHDFLQLEDYYQFDMKGQPVTRTLHKKPVTAQEFLLGKILMGDKSDNICQVFPRCGEASAYKYVKDKNLLREHLQASQAAAKQFAINKKIISFGEIPQELSEAIKERVSIELYDRRPIESKIDLNLFAM